MQTDGRTDRHEDANSFTFRDFSNALETKMYWSIVQNWECKNFVVSCKLAAEMIFRVYNGEESPLCRAADVTRRVSQFPRTVRRTFPFYGMTSKLLLETLCACC